MQDISHAYTGETIHHRDGVAYAVLDPSRLDFDVPPVTFGKKVKPTLVRIAKPGEEIVTSPGSVEESRVVAQGGELIFINQLPNGRQDAFIPRDAQGRSNGEQTLKDRYELIGGDPHGEGAFYRPSGGPSRLLHEGVTGPTAIRDVWGQGNHQFLTEGATLKCEKGRVTGIDKAAFDETWAITDPLGRILSPATGQAAQR